MADVVLDANVLVALFDADDTLHPAAVALVGRITRNGDGVLLLDFCMAESLPSSAGGRVSGKWRRLN